MKKLLLTLLSAVVLSISGFSQNDTIPNAGFEYWHFMGWYENPDGWQTNNNQLMERVVKDTNAYSGKYAMQIKATGYAHIIFPAKNTIMEREICGIFIKTKCHMEKPDTIIIASWGYLDSTKVDSSFIKIVDSIPGYKTKPLLFKKCFSNGPNHYIEIEIKGGNYQSTSVTFDKIEYIYTGTGIEDVNINKYWKVFLYGEGISMVPEKQTASESVIGIYNQLGQLVFSVSMKQEQIFIPLKQGVYLYRIDNGNNIIQSGKVLIP